MLCKNCGAMMIKSENGVFICKDCDSATDIDELM